MKRETLTLRATLPPRFDGLVFAYPRVPFTPDRVQLPELQGVAVKVDGRDEPCDGSMWALITPSVCAGGAFVALHTVNLTAESKELVLVLTGAVRVMFGPVAVRELAGRSGFASLRATMAESNVESSIHATTRMGGRR